MTEAEKHLNEYHKGMIAIMDNGLKAGMINFAESYHQSRINSISDEMEEKLNEMIEDDKTDLSWICGYQDALKDLTK